MEIILVRHAQPLWSRGGSSLTDPPLTELGREQAERLARAVADWSTPTELLVSPMTRTRETAAPLIGALGIVPGPAPWLEEIRVPVEWEGTPAESVSKAITEARDRPADRWWDGFPGGESFRAFHDRITSGMKRILGERGLHHSDRDPPHTWTGHERDEHRLLLVGHGGSNAVIIAFLLGLEPVPWEWERFASMHASVTRLRTRRLAQGQIFALQLFGDVSFLPKVLRSR